MHCSKYCMYNMYMLFCMSGVAIPSLTSFTYYLVFLILLVIWSFHQTVRLRVIVRVLRCMLTFYTMVHLAVLYLYQFQAAQQNIPLLPDNTSKSLLARYVQCINCKFPLPDNKGGLCPIPHIASSTFDFM